MDPAVQVSAIIGKYRADIAMALAAQMHTMAPERVERLLETVSENERELQQGAAEPAIGMGEFLDITV